jgi:hypothetical protein
LLLWLTGIYLFFLPIFVRRRQKANALKRANAPSAALESVK